MDYSEIALAVENYKNKNAEIFLRGLDSPDPLVVWQAIKGVGLKRIKEAIPALVKILGVPAEPLGTDGNTDLRRIAAWSLAEMGFESLLPYLGEIREHSNALLREGFADALGITGDVRAIPILDQLMEDKEPSVRSWTALSLAKLGDSSLPVIEKHFKKKPDLRTSVYLIDSLRKIGTTEAEELAKRYISQSSFPGLSEVWERSHPL
jgi:HEAT repeat protein